MMDEATGPRPSAHPRAHPRAHIVSIYGLYAREVGGWLSISSIIRLMAELGVDEPAVRSSISRLKRRGLLQAERQDGAAGYALSEHARQVLDEGDRRIFHRPRGTLDEGWVLAVFSVPESERQKRHTLRSRLSWLGFGSVSPGVWIAPGHLEAETRDVLESRGLRDYVDLFHATYLGFHDLGAEVATWWDLEGLDALYRDFHDAFAPVLETWKRRRSRQDGAAFADYVSAVTNWRRLPFLDPGLAAELLPRDWMGTQAADLFFELQDRLMTPARRHVEAVGATKV
ncbi:MAG TPA: PaaX family transcriptional regulator C-terminal domain-containing protein [Jiangellaceae bacterium]|nr:PaaX family transcriptional regulator C-terminal domain-containing protein [Jiangellaceae bacterium]